MRLTVTGCLILTAAISPAAKAQTAVDLRAQSRNIDFSAAVATRPFKTGTVLPAACSAGETYFKTDAPAGLNLYACTATNTWTGMAIVTSTNSGPGAVELIKSQAGNLVTGRQIVTGEGTLITQQTDTVTVEIDTSITPRYASAATAPTGACQTGRDQFTRVSGFPHFYGCVDGAWKPVYAVSTTAPATCMVGEMYFNPADGGLYGCTAVNQWSKFNRSGLDLTVAGECFISYSCAPTGVGGRVSLPASAVNGSIIALRVAIPHTIKLHRGLVYVTAGGANDAFTAAIYTDDAGVPGQKIAGTDYRVVDLSASSYRQLIWGTGAVVLSPAVYWLAFSSQSAAAQYHLSNTTTGYGSLLASLTVNPGAVVCTNPATGAGATYTLPVSCGAPIPVPAGFTDPPIILVSAQ